MPGKTFVPWKWPQDKLDIPNGFGGLPDINLNNARDIKRDPFVYSSSLLNIAPNNFSQVIEPTDQDGDFWLTEISISVANAANPTVLTSLLSPKINIVDLRSSRDICFPFARANLFLSEPASAFNPQLTPNFTLSGAVPQPYCFTRDGGIKFVVTNDNAATTINVHFALIGWKEYANASN